MFVITYPCPKLNAGFAHFCYQKRPKVLTLNMLNCFNYYKRYIHILNHLLDLPSPKVCEINSETTVHAVCPTQPIPCLLMLWRLLEPGHQQEWYWPLKLEYSISNIRWFNMFDIFTRISDVNLAHAAKLYLKGIWLLFIILPFLWLDFNFVSKNA